MVWFDVSNRAVSGVHAWTASRSWGFGAFVHSGFQWGAALGVGGQGGGGRRKRGYRGAGGIVGRGEGIRGRRVPCVLGCAA